MNNNSLEIGDKIAVQRLGYRHVGIYVGLQFSYCDVVHNPKGGIVELTSLADFGGNAPIFIETKATGSYFERQQIVQRALSLLGKRYDLFNFNCEHVANFAQRGKSESPQIVAFALLTLFAFGLALFSGKRA